MSSPRPEGSDSCRLEETNSQKIIRQAQRENQDLDRIHFPPPIVRQFSMPDEDEPMSMEFFRPSGVRRSQSLLPAGEKKLSQNNLPASTAGNSTTAIINTLPMVLDSVQKKKFSFSFEKLPPQLLVLILRCVDVNSMLRLSLEVTKVMHNMESQYGYALTAIKRCEEKSGKKLPNVEDLDRQRQENRAASKLNAKMRRIG